MDPASSLIAVVGIRIQAPTRDRNPDDNAQGRGYRSAKTQQIIVFAIG